MRRFFLYGGALMLMVGCGIVGTYDYDDYQQPPKASSSSSGNAGAGGMSGTGGTAGIGGMMLECQPEGGVVTPDLCNNGIDEDCVGGDCSVNATWSERYGDTLHQQVQALMATPEGGLALIGRFSGKLNIGSLPLTAPDNAQTYSYFTRLNATRSAIFSKFLEVPGNIEAIAVQGESTFITGSFPVVNTTNAEVFVRKLDKSGIHTTIDEAWELKWGNFGKISGAAIGTTQFVGAPVFVAGHIGGASTFPPGCTNPAIAPTLDSGKRYGFVMSLAPKDKTCTWGTAIENATLFSMAVNNNNVAVTGLYSAPLVGLPNPLPPVGQLSSFAVAYHPATHKVLWERYLVPTGSMDGVSLLHIAIDDDGNAFATGTFKGTLVINGKSYISEAGGTKYDLFVVAFDGTNNGNVLWFNHFGGEDVGMPPMGTTQIPYSIALAKDGLYFSGRTTAGLAIEAGKPSGPICKFTSCAFLMKLEPSTGKTIWARDFGENETASDASFRLALSADSLWLGGGWSKDVDLGTPLQANGAQDVILAQFFPLP